MQLVTKKAGLEDAITIGDWLVERSREDTVVIFEVNTKLYEAMNAIEAMSIRLSTVKSQAQQVLFVELEFSEIITDVESRLDGLELQLSMLDPISAKYRVARKQHEQFKPLFHEVQELRNVIETIAVPSDNVSEDGDVVPVESSLIRVSDLKMRWQATWDIAAKFHLKITNVLPFEERYHYAVKHLIPILDDAEEKLEEIRSKERTGDVQEQLETDIEV